MSREWLVSMFASLIAHGALFGVCRMGSARVDVMRDISAPMELHIFEEPMPPQESPVLPATGAEFAESGLVTPQSSHITRPAAPAWVAGQGALMEAKPRASQNQSPQYPWLARLRGWEGTVLVGARVDADGRVSVTWIVQSSTHATLDAAAQEAVRGWSFVPASRMCVFIASEIVVPIRFRLMDRQDQASQ